jgi:hypothetical protein
LTNALAEASGGTGTIVGYNGFKNRIINSAMVIDQRNAGASFTPTDQSYSLDRWKCRLSQASKYTVQQNAGSVTPPAGFKNYLGVTSSSAYSIGASDYFAITQIIEGYNVADLDYGTANAATITFSFWVRSSLTGTFGGALMNSAENRSYPFTYTINSANTWEKETITIAGDTSGTWLTTNGIGLYVVFGIGVGSTYSGTAGAWAASSTILSATGATSVVGTNGATFYVTGVQLEKGSTATSFDYRPYGTELALCQRYGYRIPFTGTSIGILFQAQGSGTAIAFPQHPVTMRSAPSGTFSSGWTYSINGSDTSGTISLSGSDTFTCQIEFSTSGLTAGQAGRLRSGSAFISAEL